MRLKQKRIIIIVILFGVIASFISKKSDLAFDKTRAEIKTFYETKMDSCKIVEIITMKYPGRGSYNLFTTNCSNIYFPVLLHNMTIEKEELFKKDVIITKKQNDYNLILFNNKNNYSLTIRYIQDEKDNWGLSLIIIWLFCFLFYLIIIFSNHDKRL